MWDELIDYHCHLDLYPHFEQLILDCERKRIHTLAVTTTPRAFDRNYQLTKETKYIRAALGLHPQLVSKLAGEIEIWKDLLPRTRYVGEVGLDASPQHYGSFEQQKTIFAEILSCCSAAGEKILSVHSLRTAPTVVSMIEEYLENPTCKVVLHWFTGSGKQLEKAISLGCYFSVNAQMAVTHKQQEIIKQIPIDRLLTETDGPFTYSGGRPAQPTDVGIALNQIAKLRAMDKHEIKKAILENLKSLEA